MFDAAHIHPMLVHFPIALTLLGCLLEGISIVRKSKLPCGEIILYFAAVSAIFAATAGDLFTYDFKIPELIAAKNIHSTMAGITVTLLCIATVLYIARYFLKNHARQIRYAGFFVYVLAAVSVAITGYLGGVLVYNDLLKM